MDVLSTSTHCCALPLTANAEEAAAAEEENGEGEADDQAAGEAEEEEVNEEPEAEAEAGEGDATGRPSAVSEGASAQADESDEDKQLAWEVLEVAKKIYLENSSAETDLPLANVYSRLADISRFDGHYREAIRDYTECLRLRQAALPPTSRDLADVLYNMGVCHVYLSNEQGSFKQAELREAIAKYSQARDILKKRSEEESTPSAEKDDLRSIVEDLGEEIEALQQELEQEGAGASSSSSHLPTTTIGFGGASDSSAAGAAAPAAADGTMLLQVRSKKKRPEVSQTPASTENGDSEAKRVRSD